jgi:pyruvate kinase
MLLDHKPIVINDGQELEITTDNTIEGDAKRISCTYKSLNETLKVGDVVLINDATITCIVTELLDVCECYANPLGWNQNYCQTRWFSRRKEKRCSPRISP